MKTFIQKYAGSGSPDSILLSRADAASRGTFEIAPRDWADAARRAGVPALYMGLVLWFCCRNSRGKARLSPLIARSLGVSPREADAGLHQLLESGLISVSSGESGDLCITLNPAPPNLEPPLP